MRFISLNFPIKHFTKKYPNIKITVADQDYYGIAHNEGIIRSGEASRKMKTELMAGGGPDLIFLGGFSDWNINDFYKMARSGVFEDLNRFDRAIYFAKRHKSFNFPDKK